MHTFPAKARTAIDGTLTLAIPTGLPDADVDVLVVVDLIPSHGVQSRESATAWPSGYFEEFFGALRYEGFVRHAQGTLEERDSLN